MTKLIYLDNDPTTRVDSQVVDTMLPFFDQNYGNAGSVIHAFGTQAKGAVERSRSAIAEHFGAQSREIVFTSGATESNNLAIRGIAERLKNRGNHIVSVETEHKAILEPLDSLQRQGVTTTLLNVAHHASPIPGVLSADQVAEAITDQTILVSVMMANNETGVIQPIKEIGQVCRERGVLLHCDATQAVGRMAIDVNELNIDLMSFSSHKIYGPMGVGALYIRCANPRVRLVAQIDGGGQEGRRRSGTLNVPGIVGFAKAIQLCIEELPTEILRLTKLRNRLFEGLKSAHPTMFLNGPKLELIPGEESGPSGDSTDENVHLDQQIRLAGNLNCCFPEYDGESVMLKAPAVAFSSGSACSASSPEPSHVLRAMGLNEANVRSSLRFGLGRFNTSEDIDLAISAITSATKNLAKMQQNSL